MITQPQLIDGKEVFTVYQLNQTTRNLLEQSIRMIWVKGELSNVALPRSGHIYFTLKDERAQIRCAMFKGMNQHINFTPIDGMAVLVRGQVSLYEERGDYQLIINHLEKWGLGQLQQAFEALKSKLQTEGLFAAIHKKPFPRFPRHIGVITSNTGAAIQDILSVLKRRYRVAPITLYHSQVQGKAAVNSIVLAITLANQHQQADVLILARGGGSLEDLWCFNEEPVARAIFASTIPIITGIGHEVDYTIADFVADYRAPTPSAAAETISPDSVDLSQTFEQKTLLLTKAIRRVLQNAAQKVDRLEKQLIHPGQRIQQAKARCDHLFKLCCLLIKQTIQQFTQQLSKTSSQLETVSPLATLSRGYAIVTDHQNHSVIYSTQQVREGQEVKTQLSEGVFLSIVKQIIS